MQTLTIHCQPSLLDTIKELNLPYVDNYDEVDVNIPYTLEVEDVNLANEDDELVKYFGLDYDRVNCIELSR